MRHEAQDGNEAHAGHGRMREGQRPEAGRSPEAEWRQQAQGQVNDQDNHGRWKQNDGGQQGQVKDLGNHICLKQNGGGQQTQGNVRDTGTDSRLKQNRD